MLRTNDSRRRLAAFAAASALIAGLVPAGVAAQDDATYYGCLTAESLLVDVGIGEAPAGHCAETDTLISWSEVGPQGEQGEQGPAGDNGSVPRRQDRGPGPEARLLG